MVGRCDFLPFKPCVVGDGKKDTLTTLILVAQFSWVQSGSERLTPEGCVDSGGCGGRFESELEVNWKIVVISRQGV